MEKRRWPKAIEWGMPSSSNGVRSRDARAAGSIRVIPSSSGPRWRIERVIAMTVAGDGSPLAGRRYPAMPHIRHAANPTGAAARFRAATIYIQVYRSSRLTASSPHAASWNEKARHGIRPVQRSMPRLRRMT